MIQYLEKGGVIMAYTESQKKATTKYLQSLKEVRFRIKHEEYEQIQSFAKSKDLSVRAFILQAIKHEMERG